MELNTINLAAMAEEARACFLYEDAPEYVGMLQQGLRQLSNERSKEADGVDYAALTRAAHSIKGGAGIANLPKLMQLAHLMEDLLEALQQGRIKERESVYELLHLSVEEVVAQLEAAANGQKETGSSPIEQALEQFLQDLPPVEEESFENDSGKGNTFFIQTALNADLEDCLQRVEPLLQTPGTAAAKVQQALSTLTEECLLLGQAFNLTWLTETADLIQQAMAVADSPVPEIAKVAIAEIRQMRSQFVSTQRTPSPSNALRQLTYRAPDNQAQTAATPAAPSGKSLNLRVPVARLDRMSDAVSELLIGYERLCLHQQQLQSSSVLLGKRATQLDPIREQVQSFYDELATPVAAASATGSEFDPLLLDRYTGLHRTLQDFQELMVQVQETRSDVDLLARDLQATLDQVRDFLGSLRRDLTESRLVPFNFLAERFVVPLQELNQRYHKTVELSIVGKDILIDQVILEQLQNPLTQLLRNAFDHGIEPPAERVALGKSSTARITFCASIQGNQVVLTVTDDGRGIDTQKVFRRAVEMGLCDSSAKLSRGEILEFLFQPGFSTAAKVSSLSGRGMGMDIVRLNIQQLRGSIEVKTVLGQGTTFTISLPLTLNILPVLLCRCEQRTLAIPSTSIREVIRLCDFDPDGSAQKPAIVWQERSVPVFSIVKLLPYQQSAGLPPIDSQFDHPIGVVLDVKGQPVVVSVDDLLGEKELVLKPFEPTIPVPSYLAGYTVLGTGEVVPVLSPMHMSELIVEVRPRSASKPKAQQSVVNNTPTILIVDDSVAVRRSLERILSYAGYQVVQCRDGREAMATLNRRSQLFDLVISDIEMPTMDGFALLQEVRSHSSLHSLPVAMLTSRSSDQHRKKADLLGATTYFTKPFQPTELLSAIAALLN